MCWLRNESVITDEDFSSTIKLLIVFVCSSFSVYQKYSHACRLTLMIDNVKRLTIRNARNGFKRLVDSDKTCWCLLDGVKQGESTGLGE